MSWHKKDWFDLAGVLGLGATGFGLAGMGPLAGLLGPAASTVGAAIPAADLVGGLGAGAADEAVGSMAGGTAGNQASVALGNFANSRLGSAGAGLLKGVNLAGRAGLLNYQQQMAPTPQQRPMAQNPNNAASSIQSIYPQIGMDTDYLKRLQMGYPYG